MNYERVYPSSFVKDQYLYVFGGDNQGIERISENNFNNNVFEEIKCDVPQCIVQKSSPALIPNFLTQNNILILGCQGTKDTYIFNTDTNKFGINKNLELFSEDWFHQTIQFNNTFIMLGDLHIQILDVE